MRLIARTASSWTSAADSRKKAGAVRRYGDVKWPPWRLELPVNRVFVYSLVSLTTKIIEGPRNCPFVRGTTVDRWIPRTKDQYRGNASFWWRHNKLDLPSSLWYKTHFNRQLNCWSLRCSWSIACQRCSNYIFILNLIPGFNGLGKDNYKMRQEAFKFGDLVRLILETLR